MHKTETLQHENTLTFQDAVDKTAKALEEMYDTQKKSDNADIYLAQKELLSALDKKCDTIEELKSLHKKRI